MRRTGVPVIALAAFLLAFPAATARSAPEGRPATASRPAAGWLGVFLGDALDGGVQVVALVSSGPAARAGLREGDILIEVNGRTVTDREAVDHLLASLDPGDPVRVRVLRSGEPREVELRADAPRAPMLLPAPPAAPLAMGESAALGWGRTASRETAGLGVVEIPGELRVFYGAPEDAGVLVVGVDEGSPAAGAAVRVGDVLVRAGERRIVHAWELGSALLAEAGAKPVDLGVVRDRRPLSLKISVPEESGPAAHPRFAFEVGGWTDVERLREEVARLRARVEELEREVERLKREP